MKYNFFYFFFFPQHESILNSILLQEMKHTRWSCITPFKLAKLIKLQIWQASGVNISRVSESAH